MEKIGALATLTQVSLLIGLEDDLTVKNLPVNPSARQTMEESRVYEQLNGPGRITLASLDKPMYDYIETAYRDFSAAFILADEYCNTREYLIAFNTLKLWCIRKAGDPEMVVGYLKYLLKIAQAVFLKTEMPEKLECYPQANIYEFIPSLKFIADFQAYGVRDLRLHLREAYILTQLASFNRAGPYPTHEQVREETTQTIEMLLVEKKIPRDVLKNYLGGLMQTFHRLHEPDNFNAHVSLAGSGAYENPRSEGGKADYLMGLVKDLTDTQIGPKELGSVVGLKDCLGQVVVDQDTARVWLTQMDKKPITWGHVLYVPPSRASLEVYTEEPLVPYGLARIIILVCSKDLEKFGYYNVKSIPNPMNMPLFNPRETTVVEFQPTVKSIPVKAGVSIEGAGKSRLITSAPAAYTEIGELINCFMRNWLSKDPFCRVGFEENDKLWEVLKTYQKNYLKRYQGV
jgi:hypothetical protein